MFRCPICKQDSHSKIVDDKFTFIDINYRELAEVFDLQGSEYKEVHSKLVHCDDCQAYYFEHPKEAQNMQKVYKSFWMRTFGSKSKITGQDTFLVMMWKNISWLIMNQNYLPFSQRCLGALLGWFLNFTLMLPVLPKIKGRKLRVLDLGCGDGHIMKLADERWTEKWGSDVFDEHDYYKAININYTTDITKADFPKNYFDVAYFRSTLDHMQNPIDQLVAAHKLLAKDGVMIFYQGVHDSLFGRRWHDLDLHIEYPFHNYVYTSTSLKKMLDRYGYEVVKTKRGAFRREVYILSGHKSAFMEVVFLVLNRFLSIFHISDSVIIFAKKKVE